MTVAIAGSCSRNAVLAELKIESLSQNKLAIALLEWSLLNL